SSLRARHPGRMARAVQVRYTQPCRSGAAEATRQEDPEDDAVLRVAARNPVDGVTGAASSLEIVEVNGGHPRSRAFSRDEKRVAPGLVRIGIKATAYAGWTFRGHQYSHASICATFKAQSNQVYTFAAAGPARNWALSISAEGADGAREVSASVAVVPHTGQAHACRWTGDE
ncbi:MAG TPA: hypothetical protein VGX52_09110, partial [Burkholderiales bacterium]|nr:hypothetical protein [Burkholderiales bacterium]